MKPNSRATSPENVGPAPTIGQADERTVETTTEATSATRDADRSDAATVDSKRNASVPPTAESVPAFVQSNPAQFGLNRSDQLIVGLVLAAGIVLMAIQWARLSGWGMRPIEIERPLPREFEYRLEINSADQVDWSQLPGIGDTLAERIMENREAHGPFADIDDLRRVKGIGPKTIERLRPWLRVGDALERKRPEQSVEKSRARQ